MIVYVGACALTFPLAGWSQQAGKVWRIGYLDYGTREASLDSGRLPAVKAGLVEQGYVEGKNIVFESRYANGDLVRLDEMARELAQQKVDLILTVGSEAIAALRRATTTIPIVVILTTDPVGEGNAITLARPGYNLTGMTNGQVDTVQKLIELLVLAVPQTKRIAVLTNPTNRSGAKMLQQVQVAIRQTGKEAVPFTASTPEEIVRSFEMMAREHVDALVLPADTYLISRRDQISDLALKQRLPLVTQSLLFAEVGGLMSYGANARDNAGRAGIFVEKILKGAKPGDIPFEQPTRYYLVINRKTATALGIKLDSQLLARADRVID